MSRSPSMYTTGRVAFATNVKLPSCTVASTPTSVHDADSITVTMSTTSSVAAQSGLALE